MLSKRVVLVVVALCCLFALTPSALFSQSSTTGAVTGVVTDPTGAIAPGATITLTQLGTNLTMSTTTDSSGRYLFPALSPGQYSLKCTGKGFRTTTISQMQVEVLKALTLDIKLELGAQSETIEVVAATGAELQTNDASIGTVISGNLLDHLPSQQRSITALLMLQPGVSPAGSQGDDINGGQVAGALADQTTFYVDGGDATSDLEGTNSYVSPPGEPQPAPFIAVPAETVQEFRVVTANPTSSFARSQGGEVAVLTKSGTNTVHGSAYEYYYGSGTSANSWQLNSIGRHRPHSVNNRYGGSAGGPLLKGKLFVFGNYEARRFYQATTITQLVPTDSARQGILKFKDCAAGFGPADPTTGVQPCLGGNVVSYSLAAGSVANACGVTGTSACDPRNLGMDPLITNYFKLLPEPNNFKAGDGATVPGGLNSAGFTASYAQPIIEDIAVGRLDYVINPRWNIFGTYHYNRYRLSATNQFDMTAGTTPHLVSKTPVEPRFVTFSLQGAIGSHFTSQTHGSYMRDWWGWNRAALVPQVAGTAGTLNLSGEARLASTGSTSKVWGDPINFDTQDARSRLWAGKDYFAAQDSTWIHGSHTIQFGGGYYYWSLTHQRTDIVTGGLTTGPTYYVGMTRKNGGNFLQIPASQRPPTCAPADPTSGTPAITTNCLLAGTAVNRWGNSYSSLLGLMDHSAQIATRDGNFIANPLGSPLIDHVHTHSFDVYVQDTWKATHAFTFTYGLSYGVQFAPHEIDGKQVMEIFTGSGVPLQNLQAYFAQRNAALSNGQFFASGNTAATDNTFAFAPIRHIAGRSSSADTHWNNLGPRVAVAWQPGFNNKVFGNKATVIRGGYSILWNRTNGVTEALIPLLGDGLASAQFCNGPTFAAGSTSATCSGGLIDATSGFRLGVDGSTAPVPGAANAPIPLIPGSPFTAKSSGFDPASPIPYSHNFSLDIQRSFAHGFLLDVGYIGRFARHVWQNVDAQATDPFAKTPACTAGAAGCRVATSGQTLAQAFNAINGGSTAPQPFFENAPFGCAGCTAAINAADGGDTFLSNFMLNNWDVGCSGPPACPIAFAPRPLDPLQLTNNNITTSGGVANYNAMFVTLRKSMSHGLDLSVNYTWSHSLGTAGVNSLGQQYTAYTPPTPFDFYSGYGSQNGDRRHVINASWYYELPFGRGQHFSSSSGILNRVIGGWYSAGIWQWETGRPVCITGETDWGAPNGFTCAAASLFGKVGHFKDSSGNINLFKDTTSTFNAALNSVPVLGVSTRANSEGLNEPRSWNVDLTVGKNLYASERFKLMFNADFFNAFNHPLFGTNTASNGSVSLDVGDQSGWGVVSKADNNPRVIQFGLKFQF